MTNTETMYATARAYWATPEGRDDVHGYTGLVRGLAEVLHQHGLDISYYDLAKYYHYPLANFVSDFKAERATFERIVESVDKSSKPNHDLGYPFDDILNGTHRASEAYWADRTRVDVSVLENDLKSYLKSARIRRGSKRYLKLIQEMAPRALEIAETWARARKENAHKALNRKLQNLVDLERQVGEFQDYAVCRSAIRASLLLAAGTTGDREITAAILNRNNDWDRVVSFLRARSDEITNDFIKFDIRSAAIYAMTASPDLAPMVKFLTAPGTSE